MPSGMHHDLLRRREQRVNRTYHISPATIARLGAEAARLGVGVSDLVDFLLDEALDQVEQDALVVPTRPLTLRIIDRRG